MNDSMKDFTRKVWITAGISTLVIVLLLLIKATFSVFLLILAGVLIASFFHGFGDLICRKTKWRRGACMAVAIVLTVLLLAGLSWLIGTKVQAQVNQMSEKMPAMIENAKSKLNTSQAGSYIVRKAEDPATMQRARSVAGNFFKSTFGVLGDIYVVLFLGIFFTASPTLYKKGMVRLLPLQARPGGEAMLDKLGSSLKKWLKGKLFAMFIVFVLTAIGLAILGLPMWLSLAVIAGILNFVPNFGPVIAMVPAVLVGFTQGPVTAAIVAGMYIVIQVVESNLITPMIQQKLVNIPPALIIIAQLLITPLTSAWGLLLATPLMLIIIVLVKELYVKKQEAHE